MRMMVSWKADVEATNKLIHNGKLMDSIQALIDQLQPEAAYFYANDGCRGGFLVFDMADSSQIPLIAEPLFQQHNAKVDFTPVMNQDDLVKALASVGG